MPYIKQDRRKTIKAHADVENVGELNFIITKALLAYLKKKGESYQTYNDIIGALEGAKLELYARQVRLYEAKKIKQNGDVYPR